MRQEARRKAWRKWNLQVRSRSHLGPVSRIVLAVGDVAAVLFYRDILVILRMALLFPRLQIPDRRPHDIDLRATLDFGFDSIVS